MRWLMLNPCPNPASLPTSNLEELLKDNANMGCSLEYWLEATSPSTMEFSDIWENWLEATCQPDSVASSSACKRNISPACFSGNISMPPLPDTSSLLAQSSPVYSNAYRHDSHTLDYMIVDYMNNHINDHHGINYVNDSHSLVYMNNYVNGHLDINDRLASCFGAIASHPPHELYFATGGSGPPPLPNLEARSNPHRNFEAAHNLNETRAINDSGNFEGGEIVSFLVESRTPVIEDGYKWCKYGQKNIKDKMHPRCYFKCAQRECPIKKQTEGSSNMPGFVLITYFGKHNHSQTLKENKKQANPF